jgi:hypothetical protein
LLGILETTFGSGVVTAVAAGRIGFQSRSFIEGAVRDEKGKPLQGVELMATLNPEPGESNRSSSNSGVWRNGASDLKGRYQIEKLAPGCWNVRAVRFESYKDLEFNRIPEVVVRAGETVTGVDLTGRPKKRNGLIRGILADLRSKPAGNWEIRPQLGEGASEYPRGSRVASHDGKFELKEVGEGKFWFVFVQSTDERTIYFRTAEMEASEEERVFILPTGGVLRGRVVDGKTSQPISGALVRLNLVRRANKPPSGTQVELSSFYWKTLVRTGEDGRFSIGDLPVSSYKVAITSQKKTFAETRSDNVVINTSLETDLGDIEVEPE